ncbi:hypothetical protein [Nonomuraea sediminis]|uniref:hypothetical protein n=1 Tax=Nonomuraea sediminis TaxID=2835864 RepID=UPI001BDBC3F7|nr:hypothetical protein [Nonomuraea sediminis]
MTRTITGWTDRLVNVFAPKATARAASYCAEQFCYCSGTYLYKRDVCLFDDGSVWYGNCHSVGHGC